jgi:hypothetical protein
VIRLKSRLCVWRFDKTSELNLYFGIYLTRNAAHSVNKEKEMKRFLFTLFFGIIFVTVSSAQALVATYDDLTLASDSYWNGSDLSGGFSSGSIYHPNYYDYSYGPYWEKFAYSNQTDTSRIGTDGQFVAYSNAGNGGGYNGSSYFAIGYNGFYGETYINVTDVTGVYITNNAYAYHAMKDGYGVASEFGADDFFKLTVTGYDSTGSPTGFADLYLAQFPTTYDESQDNFDDYVLSDWTYMDLTGLQDPKLEKIVFQLSSSDTGDWGMNTPAYFAMDNLEAVPIPGAVWLLGSLLLAAFGFSRRRSS